MKTSTFCPISSKKIDEHVARLNGAFTVIFLSVFLITGNIVLILFLLIDFALRSGKYAQYSVFAMFSKFFLKSFLVKPLMINAGPKIFASRIGLVFVFGIITSYLFGLYTIATVFSVVFGICAFLESGFGFCVACQIYPVVYKLMYFNKVEKLEI